MNSVNFDDVDDKMNFSFTEGGCEDQQLHKSYDAIQSKSENTAFSQLVDQRNESFGELINAKPAVTIIDDELSNAVAISEPVHSPKEEQILQKYGIQKITGAQLQNMRHQTNASMRSNTSGLSSLSQTTAGGSRRDQAPNKKR